MPNGVRGSALRQIHALYSVGTLAGLGDGPLLERFATLRGEEAELAFAALMARHGPMVLRVCRRVLATSTTRTTPSRPPGWSWRKAGSLRDRGSVGNWLFGVASPRLARRPGRVVAAPAPRTALCRAPDRPGPGRRSGRSRTGARCSTKN